LTFITSYNPHKNTKVCFWFSGGGKIFCFHLLPFKPLSLPIQFYFQYLIFHQKKKKKKQNRFLRIPQKSKRREKEKKKHTHTPKSKTTTHTHTTKRREFLLNSFCESSILWMGIWSGVISSSSSLVLSKEFSNLFFLFFLKTEENTTLIQKKTQDGVWFDSPSFGRF